MTLRLRNGWVKNLTQRQGTLLGFAQDPNPPLNLETVAAPGTTHDGQVASVGTSTTTLTPRLTIAAATSSSGTSTTTFTGTLVSAGPSVIVINRGIRVTRGTSRRR